MLQAIGVGDHLSGQGCPIRQIRVADGLAPGGLSFMPEEDGEPLGWMHENRHLRAALQDLAEAGATIDLRWGRRAETVARGEHGVTVTLDDGAVLRAALLVAAEGRNSPTREEAGIRMARWPSWLYRARARAVLDRSPSLPACAA